MKKLIVPMIAVLLILIIGSFSLYNEGYRIIKDKQGITVGIPVSEEQIAREAIQNKYITIKEYGLHDTYSYDKAGVQAMVSGIKYNPIIVDYSGLVVTRVLPLDSTIYSDIDSSRTEYNPGTLVFDEDYNLMIEGYADSNKISKNDLHDFISGKVRDGLDVEVELKDFYVEHETSEEVKNMKKSIEDYEKFHIVYSNGFDLSSKVLAKRKLINIEEDGTYTVNITEPTCRDIAGKNLTGYNTIGLTYDFVNHKGEEMRVKSQTYGNYIDYDAEGKYLLEAITNKVSEEHRVPILKQSEEFALDDTYIELDKNEQHIYYYKNGELFLDSDVVTGLPTKRRDTPTGIYFIINKAQDTRLKGESWDVEVDYWMGVTYNGVGFHDASWRDRFGGNIWKNNGSHGCINTPLNNMKKLYENVQVGTPVVIY